VSTAAPLGKWGKTNPIQVWLPLGTRQEGGVAGEGREWFIPGYQLFVPDAWLATCP
jgi:hypothetical protein